MLWHFRQWSGKTAVKSSGLKCTEHNTDVFDGSHLARFCFRKSTHFFLLLFGSGRSSPQYGIKCMPQPAATHLVGISFKFSKDFEGLSTRLASKQRENAETELRRVLVLTSYTASPMSLKRGREPIWPHFC